MKFNIFIIFLVVGTSANAQQRKVPVHSEAYVKLRHAINQYGKCIKNEQVDEFTNNINKIVTSGTFAKKSCKNSLGAKKIVLVNMDESSIDEDTKNKIDLLNFADWADKADESAHDIIGKVTSYHHSLDQIDLKLGAFKEMSKEDVSKEVSIASDMLTEIHQQYESMHDSINKVISACDNSLKNILMHDQCRQLFAKKIRSEFANFMNDQDLQYILEEDR